MIYVGGIDMIEQSYTKRLECLSVVKRVSFDSDSLLVPASVQLPDEE